MKKCLFLRVLTMVIISVLMLSGIAVAADTAEVVFETTDIEGDIVELDVTVKNATFMVVETAVRYDTNIVEPVNESDEKATSFDEFATKTEQADFFNTVALTLDAEKGVLGFTMFIIPGEDADGVSEKGEYVAGEDGIKLYKFRFKRIAEGNPGIEVAFKDDIKAYKPILPEGITIMNYSEGSLAMMLSYIYNGSETEKVNVVPQPEVKFTAAERKKDVICMQIGKARAISKGKKAIIDPENTRVVPYIANDRTLVPIRFITEALGAEILWEEGWTYCIIKKDGNEIKLNFNSAEFEVNGEKVSFDAPVEVTQDRTMVPVRFVSEHLDCDVYWSERHKAVVIAPKDNPWQADREAEITALNEMLVSITGILP